MKALAVTFYGILITLSLYSQQNSRMDTFGSGGGEMLARETNTTFLGKIPIDQNVRIGGDTGKPIVASFPESAVAQSLQEISQKIAARVTVGAMTASNALPINIVE